MIVEPRFTAILLILTAGGLLLTAFRYRSDPQLGQLALDILDESEEDSSGGYNYCQAQRPSLKTYPLPKVRSKAPRWFIPNSLYVMEIDINWDCSNTSSYSFTAPGADQLEKPFYHANVIAHQIISIPPGSPFAMTHMWKGNCIPGQLTSIGAVQHRRLGAALRQIYVDKFKLLPATYDPESLHIRSTDVWRTKVSTESFMAGFYGVPAQAARNTLPVLQIHTLPAEIDYLTMNGDACPRINQLRSVALKNSEVLKKLEEDNKDFKKELVEILGAEKSWSGFMDTVLPRICHKKPLQCRHVEGNDKCVTNPIAERILEVVGTQTTEVYRDMKGIHDVLQLGMGPLTNEIKQNLLTAMGNGKVRLHFYSGHDTTVMPLLGMLNARDLRWPPYASNILIELWKTQKGEHFVRVLYNHKVLETKSEWCDLEWCPLDTFVNYLDRFIVPDLITQCQAK
ncbi:hypothetical protein BGX28_009254 [Mortierella sp. GBA30]|nr:hypothetical protein BGX28_009254 [Mortierella sp. GBA30]